ncbi:hypothetical protein BGZ82_002356 [Podila clonocystis]|nr:hypothetical protein BGZ82_002356 [Podila clonocystis]
MMRAGFSVVTQDVLLAVIGYAAPVRVASARSLTRGLHPSWPRAAEVPSSPVLQAILTNQISDDITCITKTCMVGLENAVTVSTTRSFEISMAIEAGAKPFGVGVTFMTTLAMTSSATWRPQ